VQLVCDGDESLGVEAVELAAAAGLVLDEWEALVLRSSLTRVPGSDRWAAFETGLVVPRQNGKGAILEARELAGLFLLGERLLIHSAHQFDTSLEAFRRLEWLVLDTPDLEKQVKRISRSHGEEGLEIKGGCRIRFRTRTKGGGRGFSSDCLILDEAMFLSEFSHGALLPTLSARPNPQVWYTGSAVDQLVHEHGVVLARVRERALRQEKRLTYFEWSLPHEDPDLVGDEVAQDPVAWRQANPALGIRIDEEHVDSERRSMDPRTFAVERLGVGDWPPTSATSLIDLEKWASLTDLKSEIVGDAAFAFDVKPDRSAATIAVCGKRADGLLHVEIVERRRGTEWIPARILELLERHKSLGVFCDPYGPAGSLVSALEAETVVTQMTAREMAFACGMFYDTVEQDGLRHLGTPELIASLRGAQKRVLGDAWAWSRKNSNVDIGPLVAATIALWGASVSKPVEVFASAW